MTDLPSYDRCNRIAFRFVYFPSRLHVIFARRSFCWMRWRVLKKPVEFYLYICSVYNMTSWKCQFKKGWMFFKRRPNFQLGNSIWSLNPLASRHVCCIHIMYSYICSYLMSFDNSPMCSATWTHSTNNHVSFFFFFFSNSKNSRIRKLYQREIISYQTFSISFFLIYFFLFFFFIPLLFQICACKNKNKKLFCPFFL